MGIVLDLIKVARGAKPSAKAGGGLSTAKAIRETEAALARLAAERADANQKIKFAFDRRRAALLKDEAFEEIAKIQAEAERGEITLEQLELIEAELLSRLDALKSDARREAWAQLLREHRAAAGAYLEAYRAMLVATAGLRAVADHAIAGGFEAEQRHAFLTMPTPHLILPDVLTRLEREHDRLAEMVIDPVRPKPPTASQAKPKPQAWAPGDLAQPGIDKRPAAPMGRPPRATSRARA